jgi:hypothetical protein
MSEDMTYVPDVAEPTGNGRDNRTMIIIVVVLVVLCCCCLVVAGGGWWLWNNGDELFGLTANFLHSLL